MTVNTVSVVIPVFNGERYLAAAIDSVAGETPRVDEIIVVDDGSTDSSAAIARAHPFGVICISQANAGISAARNRGLAAARGEVIGFLDADDLWAPGRLRRQLGALAQNAEADLVFGQVEQFVSEELDDDSRRRLYCPPGLQPGYLVGAMLARRGVFDRVGGFEVHLRTGEFVSWMLRCRQHRVVEIMLPDLVLRRRLHGLNHGVVERESRVDFARVLRAHLTRRRDTAE